ncbi:MAG: TetR/AcrR family transcriptional regulator [Steroidobacteraceae bacterium]|nr:TetR/AcrR family transcriptional regulator [Steroidobacteraceae bacterium]
MQRDVRRMAVLEAAARILETRGLEALTTNAAAERAGVSIGSLYQYFPSKQALVAELARRQQAGLLAALERELQSRPPRSLADGVRRLARIAAQAQLERAALARALDQAEANQPADAELERTNRRIGALVADVLRQFAPTAAPVEVATRDVFAIVRGMTDAAGRAGEDDPAGLAARVTRAVLGLLGP